MSRTPRDFGRHQSTSKRARRGEQTASIEQVLPGTRLLAVVR